MELETTSETLPNGRVVRYQIVNGTAYHLETSKDIIHILESCRFNLTRLRIYYGDTKTGHDWEEVYDVTGRISRSGGNIKIPLLIYNTRSLGGSALLDHCIVRIETSKRKCLLYSHVNYHKS